MSIFFILMIYFALSVFLAIYADSLRITLLHLGYPSMQRQKDKWGYRSKPLSHCRLHALVLLHLPTQMQEALQRREKGRGRVTLFNYIYAPSFDKLYHAHHSVVIGRVDHLMGVITLHSLMRYETALLRLQACSLHPEIVNCKCIARVHRLSP